MASTHAATPGGPSVPPRSSRARRISHIDATIARIAADQLGVISNRQVAQHGISRQALNRRQHTGVLVPMFLGVYRLTATPASNLQRALAACIGVPNSAISGRWAALIHGFPLPTQHFGHLNVSLAISHGRHIVQPGIDVARHRFPLNTKPWMTVQVLTPRATLLELAAMLPPKLLGRCIDHCIANRILTAQYALDWLAQLPANRISGRILFQRELEARTSGIRHRSKLEVKVGEWLDRIGLVGWVPNYQVLLADATKIEVDFAWPKLRVCLEVSPSYTHGAQDTQDRDSDRRRLLLLDGWRLVEAGDRHLESFETMDPIFDALRHLIDQTGPGDVH